MSIIDKAKPMAAAMMEADAGDIEFKDGTFKVAGTDKAIPLTEVAKASFAPMGPMTKFGIGLEGSGSHSPEPPSHPNGAHAVEVEIDPETGEVKVDRYVMVDDLGQVLNPMIVNGQQHGGVAQGIGQALYEHAVYDRESAQLVTGSFMDYVMPRADMLMIPRPSAANRRTTGPRPERTARGAGRRLRALLRERERGRFFDVLRERVEGRADVLALLREPGGEDVRVAMVTNLGHRHSSHTDHTPHAGHRVGTRWSGGTTSARAVRGRTEPARGGRSPR